MTDLLATGERALQSLRQKGAEKAQVSITRSEVQEFEIQNSDVALLRSTFDQNITVKVVQDQRLASQSNNQFSSASLEEMTASALKQARASSSDAAYDIAPAQGTYQFKSGLLERNDDWAFKKVQDLLGEIKTKFPKAILESSSLKYVLNKSALMNSNGVQFESEQGSYEIGLCFASKDGKNSSSLNYFQAHIGMSNESLLSFGGAEELLHQSAEQTETRRIPEKFDGELIITPHCLGDFLWSILSYLRTGSLLAGQSIYKDKLNEQIAASHFQLRALPRDERFIRKSFWTSDGFLTENQNLIENGVLKNFLLDQYGSRKLNAQRSVNEGSHLVIDPGTGSFANMIKSVRKGILLCRFSGGSPAENGDLSGVAKNSYYIENGEIQYPVGETMVSGNLARMLLDLGEISKETINFGTTELPWVKVAGFTVS